MDGAGRQAGTQRGKDAAPDAVLEEIVRRLVATYRPQRVYLFGSRASGEASTDSDYDVLVVVEASEEPMHRRARAAHAAFEGIPAAVDVLVWTREEFDERLGVVTSLPATVVRYGKLLHAA